MKRNKDAGERIKLLPQTAWSDYFFFQNMQVYIWIVDLSEEALACAFRRAPERWRKKVFCRAEEGYNERQVLETQVRNWLFK